MSRKKRKYKIYVINFADKNYRNAQRINTRTALAIGNADKVFSFNKEDIDQNFFKENEFILKQDRGAGMWLWKPYFVNKVLENINYGDYIFYCDSGAFFIRSIENLIGKAKDSDIVCCDIPLIEQQFTKQKTFEFVGGISDKYSSTNQIIATFFMIKKTKFTVDFVNEWLSLCCNESYILPDNETVEFSNFIAHREDQSIFSLLCKKYDIEPFEDISQRKWFPYSYKYENYIFRKYKHNLKAPVILYLHKMSNPKFSLLMRQALNYIFSWKKYFE